MAAFVFVFLTGVAGGQDPISEGMTFSGEINYDGTVEGTEGGVVVSGGDGELRCLADPFSVPSQGLHVSGSGLHVSGSVGGMVLGEIELLDEFGDPVPNGNPIPIAVGDAWQGTGATSWLQGLQPSSDTDVVILIADDFDGGRFLIPADAFTLQPDAEGDLAAMVDSGELSHGALVTHHLNALLSASEAFELDAASSNTALGHTVWIFRAQTSSRLVVHGIDLSSGSGSLINTGMIVNALSSGMEGLFSMLGEARKPETHVVINMSWVLLPCPTVEQFQLLRADFATFERYLEGLSVPSDTGGSLQDGDGYVKNVLQLLSFVNPDDPLFSAIQAGGATAANDVFSIHRYFEEARIALVAATGNFGMKYQMLPAAWSMVVGAGAPDEPPPPFSNVAEVSAPGAWFRLEPLAGIDGPLTPGIEPQVSYAGTSFSAPMVSLLTALDLSAAGPCTPTDFRTMPPGLASDPPGDVAVVQALGNCGNSP